MNIARLRTRSRGLAVIAALALGAAACDDEPAPLIEIEGTGDVEGLLFLDVDENGVFDPAGGDIAVPGVSLSVRERSGSTVLASGITTGANGRFVISGLPLGTHEIVFDTASVPDQVSICQNPIPVSVFRDETTFANVQGRPACLITIGAATKEPIGAFVIVRGVVTSFPNQQDPNWTIIEDQTGGIQLFGSGLNGQGIEIGDLIEVGGVVEEFNGRLELINPQLRQRIAGFGAIRPQVATLATLSQSTSARDPLQNRLFTVKRVKLTTGFTSGGSRNAIIQDETGTLQIRVEDNVSAGRGDEILSTLGIAVGKCYDLTGILAGFRGTPQLFPRSAADFQEVACS